MKKIFFDMDGTVADLYGRDGWLESIQNEEAGLFLNLEPLHDTEAFDEMAMNLISNGWSIGIITWLPMNASFQYMETVAKEKWLWAQRFMPYISEFHAIPYGMPKQNAPFKKAQKMVLVDDNYEVLRMWTTGKQRVGIQVLETTDAEDIWMKVERMEQNG